MNALYEQNCERGGSGSGVYRQEFGTALGNLTLIHWSIHQDTVERTSLSLRSYECAWPVIYLAGFVKPSTEPLSFYLTKLFQIGGVSALEEAIQQVSKTEFHRGADHARVCVRVALGL